MRGGLKIVAITNRNKILQKYTTRAVPTMSAQRVRLKHKSIAVEAAKAVAVRLKRFKRRSVNGRGPWRSLQQFRHRLETAWLPQEWCSIHKRP